MPGFESFAVTIVITYSDLDEILFETKGNAKRYRELRYL